MINPKLKITSNERQPLECFSNLWSNWIFIWFQLNFLCFLKLVMTPIPFEKFIGNPKGNLESGSAQHSLFRLNVWSERWSSSSPDNSTLSKDKTSWKEQQPNNQQILFYNNIISTSCGGLLSRTMPHQGRRISSSTEEFEAVEGTLSIDSCLKI